MKRRDFLKNSAFIASAALLPINRLANLFQDSPFTTLRRNVGYFTGGGGTIGWFATNEALVVIDSQFPNSAQVCLDGLKEMTSHPVDYLINTHHHGDHTGGNSVFKGVAKEILAHRNVPVLQKRAAEPRGQEALDAQVYPTKTYSDSWKESFGDEIVHAFNYGAAHTGGDSVVYFENANIAHMGDLVFNRAHPFIDTNGGANIQNWILTLTRVADDLPTDTQYIFGHGNRDFGIIGTNEDLRHKASFLSALLEYTQKGINEDKSVEEISDLEMLPGFENFKAPGWNLPLSRNIIAAHVELSR